MNSYRLLTLLPIVACSLSLWAQAAPEVPAEVNDPDYVVRFRSRAQAAAVVVLVETEPVGDRTRLKIVEYWKRKVPESTLSQHFGNGYLPYIFPSNLSAGQQILAFYYLPAHKWDSQDDIPLGPVIRDGKFDFSWSPTTKHPAVYSVEAFKKLLANDKEPIVLPEPQPCRIK